MTRSGNRHRIGSAQSTLWTHALVHVSAVLSAARLQRSFLHGPLRTYNGASAAGDHGTAVSLRHDTVYVASNSGVYHVCPTRSDALGRVSGQLRTPANCQA